ncbi:unnamed protein product [Miscanthus lutarioriparius]|uniref:Uncharacterized protein n=1 Tax=Miscanthus lutarioriparius TaxID=422564 RepID=A0A811MPZ3_9POAL|nr:unnamed protein product [Miscanthus lutarioriparius]
MPMQRQTILKLQLVVLTLAKKFMVALKYYVQGIKVSGTNAIGTTPARQRASRGLRRYEIVTGGGDTDFRVAKRRWPQSPAALELALVALNSRSFVVIVLEKKCSGHLGA